MEKIKTLFLAFCNTETWKIMRLSQALVIISLLFMFSPINSLLAKTTKIIDDNNEYGGITEQIVYAAGEEDNGVYKNIL